MSKIIKTRLNKDMRTELNQLASDCVSKSGYFKPSEESWRKALDMVLPYFEEKYPPADMAVLSKYRKAGIAQTVYVYPGDSRADGDRVSLPCDARFVRPEYADTKVGVDKKVYDAVRRWKITQQQCQEASEKVLDAYKTLIRTSTYLEDVVAVWPEAAGISSKPAANLPALPETVKLIELDIKRRASAAKE